MAFCLCQRFNIKKNGNQFVELNNGAGFNFSWTLSSTSSGKKKYLTYKIEMSKINERFQLDSVHLKTEICTYEVDPKNVITVTVRKDNSKFVTLRVDWKFKNAPGTKSISESTNLSTPNVYSICQRLTIHKDGNIFVKLNNEYGFTFCWEKYGKPYRKEKHYFQLYHLKVSGMYYGLQFEDIKLKHQNSTYTMSSGIATAVEMSQDSPRMIELNVLWSYKNDYDEAKKDCGKAIVDLKRVLQEQMENSDDQKKKNESEAKYIFQYIPPTPSTETIPKISTLEENETPKIHDDNSDPSPVTSPLVDVFISKKYSDVIFHTNDSKKVFAHRCILFSFSDIFAALFDRSSDIPVEIEVDFPEAIVTRAIEFCYGKNDGIQNFEEDLIKFADNYGIKGLKKVCLKSLKDRPLTTENVCKIVEIAFEQNYTLLKQKCLQFILEKKNELGEEKLSKLPTEILVSTILSL